MASVETMKNFLKDDLYNSLKELFVGAVTWAYGQRNDVRYMRDLGMFTCFVQARALYEFFYKKKKNRKGNYQPGGTASARHFLPSWTPQDHQKLYANYMCDGAPAQKRVFHLVYGRSRFSGGVKEDESDHIKNQVLVFARDIKRLTVEFAASVKQGERELVECALANALLASRELAESYGICDPL
jgi:hypothetical protein